MWQFAKSEGCEDKEEDNMKKQRKKLIKENGMKGTKGRKKSWHAMDIQRSQVGMKGQRKNERNRRK